MSDQPNFVPGPAWPGNYVQPNSGNPAPNPAVTVQPIVANDPKGNPMNLAFPVPLPGEHGPGSWADSDKTKTNPFPRGVQPWLVNVSG